MPTTTRSRTTQKSRSVLERGPGFEALGAGIAPGLPGEDRSERERAEIGAGQPRRGAPAADPLGRWPLASELIDEAVESAAGRRRLRRGRSARPPSPARKAAVPVAGRVDPDPGAQRLVIDVDSFIQEVHGKQKHGASYGYTGKLGYHP